MPDKPLRPIKDDGDLPGAESNSQAHPPPTPTPTPTPTPKPKF